MYRKFSRVSIGVWICCACIGLLEAKHVPRLPDAIFSWMDAKDRTGIRGDRLPFFDEKGVYVRPSEDIRAFRSAAVDALVEKVTAEIPDAKFKTLFANCYPNTIDTTVSYRALPDGDDDTFVYTGDIPAMWLRDSSAQVWPYLPLAKDDEPLRKMIRGVLRRQFKSILIDPYANAFNPDASGRGHPNAPTEMKPEIWERKYEIDSLCYPIRLAYGYWKETGDASVFDATWLTALDRILETFRTQQHKQGWKTPYRFAGDGVPNHGYGAPVKPVGLIASFFRPSDDACVYPFLVPSNFFAVDVLKKAAEIVRAVNRDTERMRSCHALAHEVETALGKYAVVKHPKYGDIYAYEIDGFGNALLIDDANVPSLLALPYFSEVRKDDPVYLNTRRFVFSADNPYYFEGKSGAGIGGPHCGFDRIWPMSYVFKALTATDDADIVECLRLLRASDAGKGLMHESYDKDDPSVFSRAWFAWANSIFGELIIKLRDAGKLHLLQAASVEKTVRPTAGDATAAIQAAIDDCFRAGGGRVTVEKGDYDVTSFRLRSHVTLYLKSGAKLHASRNPSDYDRVLFDDALEPVDFSTLDQASFLQRTATNHWNNGIVRLFRAEGAAIVGEPGSEIDGRNCYDEHGEETYRGPHGISAHFVTNLVLKGYAIRDTGNWAHRLCLGENIRISDVTILGGHDGIDFHGCAKGLVENCDIRSGDDCVAGYDNVGLTVRGCRLNSSCSIFRLGGRDILCEDIDAVGPGEYPHRARQLSPRQLLIDGVTTKDFPDPHTLSFFTFYGTKHTVRPCGNIVLRNCRVRNIIRFLHYNFSGNEPWQQGMPLDDIMFENVEATGVEHPLTAYAPVDHPTVLTFRDCSLSFNRKSYPDGVESFIKGANLRRIEADGLKVLGVEGPFYRSWNGSTELKTEGLEGIAPSVQPAQGDFGVGAI